MRSHFLQTGRELHFIMITFHFNEIRNKYVEFLAGKDVYTLGYGRIMEKGIKIQRAAAAAAPRALKNPEGFFNAKEEELRAPETLRRFRAAH